MKTMVEIINSITDESLKKFAIKIQEKLEIARNSILEKIKSGNEVVRAEISALKTSISSFVSKHKGSIPQRTAALLSAALLVSMLASCDSGLVGGLFPSVFETSAETAEEGANIEKYKVLVVEEVSVNGKDLSSSQVGLETMNILDYKNIMTSGSNSDTVISKYNDIMKNPKTHNWEKDDFLIMAINSVANPNRKRDVVAM